MTKIEELAKEIRSFGYWVPELLEELCKEAGMSEEWDAAGEEFEAVALAAAEKLNVEIL